MVDVTLCYLLSYGVNGKEVCLATKKKRHVHDRLNAAGGHREPEETTEEAALRELWQEQKVRVNPTDLRLVAVIEFTFPGLEHEDMLCWAYTVEKWHGQPMETDEMGPPQWFPLANLPFEQMPDSDRFWLLSALRGERDAFAFELDGEYQVLNPPS